LTVQVKICGLCDEESVAAAVTGGARYLGFVFCPKSRHKIDALTAASLMAGVPAKVESVGLFVDPSDEELRRALNVAPISMIQLHGSETPERVVNVKKLTKCPVIKAIGIATSQDIAAIQLYESVADFLLLDAKAPLGGYSGGNGVAFDWALLKSADFSKPWLLAGGLNPENIEAAVAATNACILDVSSGVEDAAGQKSPIKIKNFLDIARKL
jgi:phosphoribosylanthranilate isomerase